jgi:transposase
MRKRREAVIKAVAQYGYRQQEIASHLGLQLLLGEQDCEA